MGSGLSASVREISQVPGTGLFLLVPVMDTLSAFVDQRVRTSMAVAESTLSCDIVPVNVHAIVFWLVLDVQKSIFEVSNYEDAIALSAQTALRQACWLLNAIKMVAEAL